MLPLSEFPLNSDNPDSDTDGHGPSSDPSPPQLFQFFRDDYTPQHMSSAEDIIFHGRLVPFKQAPPPHPPPRPPNYRRLLGRQFGSLSDSKTSRPEIQVRYERNCRSLDSQKTGRSEIDRNSSGKSVGSVSGGRSTRFTKFRWLMFGMVKLPPPEMELRDIKNRQTRRSPTTMFSPDSRRSGSGKGSSAVLRALSCRDDASVAVAMPFGCVPST